MKWLITGIAGLAGIIVVAAFVMIPGDSADTGERADVAAQGGEGQPFAAEGAWLSRSNDGIRVRATIPTPAPGSYEYPTSDMVAPWAQPHPEILPAGDGEYEVFTMWVIVFNHPDLCTDESCDLDDLSPDAAAKGGVFQADGRIADGDELELTGSVRIGQVPSTGSPLEASLDAEVHVAIAPHGRALTGADLERQLNGPIGNPTLWWAATFDV
jgi:hypothetical protein